MRIRIFSMLLILIVSAYAPAVLLTQVAKAQEVPPVQTGYSSISVEIDNTKFHEIYDFVTDLNNDSLWFPGVEETIVVSEGNKKGIGKQYVQRTYFAGIPLDTLVEVKDAKAPKLYYIEGEGMVATFKAWYTFKPAQGSNGGVFTLTTEFTSPGLTEEALGGLITLAMQNLLSHFESTGEITLNYLYIQ